MSANSLDVCNLANAFSNLLTGDCAGNNPLDAIFIFAYRFLNGLILGFLFNILFNFLPSKVIWKNGSVIWSQIIGKKQNPPVIVLASTPGINKVDYIHINTDMGQVKSVAALTPSLSKAYRLQNAAISVIFSGNHGDNLVSRDVVTLGGLKFNEVSATFLNDFEQQYGNEYSVVNQPSDRNKGDSVDVPRWGDKVYFSTKNIVYGTIIRTKNLHDSNYTTFIAGAGTYGTEAAANALAQNAELRRWLRWGFDKKEFVALVKANLIHGDDARAATSSPTLLAVRRISKYGIDQKPWVHEEELLDRESRRASKPKSQLEPKKKARKTTS